MTAQPGARTPPPLRETPPQGRFCDLVLNGGVASGVVYPWALLELARHYRFKNVGGNSVGAMAAALAAAAEHGRCNGVENAFEPLRQLPLKLAELKDPRDPKSTKMFRLFQAGPDLQRLFKLFLAAVSTDDPEQTSKPAQVARMRDGLIAMLRIYGVWPLLQVLLALTAVALVMQVIIWGVQAVCAVSTMGTVPVPWGEPMVTLFNWARHAGALFTIGVVAIAFVAGVVVRRVLLDLKALEKNHYGFCTGLGLEPTEEGEGLVEWLHRGIQQSAGRKREDPPLTFSDLWAAPRFGRVGPAPLQGGLQPPEPGINLQMFTSNVTQGRPVRLPLHDANTRLYYRPDEWAKFFPPTVLKALEAASEPYRPDPRGDPPLDNPSDDAEQRQLKATLRELPSGAMPIVVAARLSLSFPLLFSFVPVYAVDYEMPLKDRKLRCCLLSDGGLCTNFPVHLFDAAHPRWPTFALLLDRRLKSRGDQSLWLPRHHLDGRADNWQDSVPCGTGEKTEGTPLGRLLGLLGGVILTMKDWNDRVTGRLPQVRNRIIRLALRPGEGQLNIAMPGTRILSMAYEYGTKGGRKLVERFAPDREGVKPAWREHVYVRSMIEVRSLRKHLKGYSDAVRGSAYSEPLGQLLAGAVLAAPLATSPKQSFPDPTSAELSIPQRRALAQASRAVAALESRLAACEAQFGPYVPVLEPEMRLRPPI